MSTLLKEIKTPKNIRGVEIDEKQKIKYSANKKRVLEMEIIIEEPVYDEEGSVIVPDANSSESQPEHLDGIFMAQLLDEEYQDQQDYYSPKVSP
jgi:hypothetical protein